MTTRTTRAIASLLCGLLATALACKSDTPAASEERPDLGPKASAVNELLPADLKDKLSFEVQEVSEGNVLALVPKGWQPSFIPGRLEPGDGKLGERLAYEIGSNCDGVCAKKDWASVANQVEFSNTVPPGLKVEVDEALGETGRLEVFAGSDEVYVRAAWWLAESKRYFYCRADLRGAVIGAKQAFIDACKATHVLDWD